MKQIEMHVQAENTRLVRTVKKYPPLYDITCPEYSLKQHTTQCWQSVSDVIGLTPQDCRTRWRNLRISYLRYLRQSKSNTSRSPKPYYLNSEMSFMESFVRFGEPKNNSAVSFKLEDDGGELDQDGSIIYTIHKEEGDHVDHYTAEIIKATGTSIADLEEDEEEEYEEVENIVEIAEPEVRKDVIKASQRKSQRNQMPPPQQQQVELVEEPQQQQQHAEMNESSPANSSLHTDQLMRELAHPDLAFFRSLMPDMEVMNPSQKAKFKFAVMTSLNEILYP